MNYVNRPPIYKPETSYEKGLDNDMKLYNIPSNSDTIKVIRAHTEDLYDGLKYFLRNFDETEIQSILAMFAELENDYLKN